MQFLSSIKHALGLHGCTLALEEVTAQARSLGELSFRVVLRGGARALRVRELDVRLEEERLIHLDPGCGEFGYWTTVVRMVMPLPRMVLAPHASVRVPVLLPLPELEPSMPLRRYSLLVTAEVPGFNPQTSRLVAVGEPPALHPA